MKSIFGRYMLSRIGKSWGLFVLGFVGCFEMFQTMLGQVHRNVRLADMNLDVPVQDALEVVCNGLRLRHGEQPAVDATLVSPFGRDGQPRVDADVHASIVVARAPAANDARRPTRLARTPGRRASAGDVH